MRDVVAVILAAGYGTRMRSKTPKVLHSLCGKPMVSYVIDAARAAGATRTLLVVGPEVELFRGLIGDGVDYCIQHERRGTGHAVLQAEDALGAYDGDVLVLLGDMPLLPPAQLTKLLDAHRSGGAAGTVLSSVFEDATGYGRIFRDADGFVDRIVEQKDASPEELAVKEGNSGLFCFDSRALFAALRQVTPHNAQNEYYMTDVPPVLRQNGLRLAALISDDCRYGMGINSRAQLSEVSEVMRREVLSQLMEEGVTIIDPNTTYVDAGVSVGCDTTLLPMTMLEGNTRIGENCRIGPSTRLTNAKVGNSVDIQNSIVIDSTIGDASSIGPFAYVRPGSVLHENVKVGDFVEIKKSEIMRGSKVPHLSYVGDATIGEGVNIGCGTITCNYDGRHKHRTIVGDRAFIGSNTNLVAPVTVGDDAFVAAGSTITKDVPNHSLAIARTHQRIKENWRRHKRSEDESDDLP